MRIRRLVVLFGLLGVGTSSAGAGGWPPRPPAAVLDTLRLRPIPARVVVLCRRQQARVHFTVLCPRRLPRAVYGWGHRRPELRATAYGAVRRGRRIDPFGLEFGYSAPVEPTSGRGWRRHLWLNRPCCFLHFTVYRRPPEQPLPPGVRAGVLGGRRGLVKPAKGYGFSEATGIYWPNHTWFFWHERGAPYAASLHYFGRGTQQLFARLVKALVPAGQLGF